MAGAEHRREELKPVPELADLDPPTMEIGVDPAASTSSLEQPWQLLLSEQDYRSCSFVAAMDLRRLRQGLEPLHRPVCERQLAVIRDLGGGAVGEAAPRLHLEASESGSDRTSPIHHYRSAELGGDPGIVAAISRNRNRTQDLVEQLEPDLGVPQRSQSLLGPAEPPGPPLVGRQAL
jgi:hypothetical protein